MKSEDAWNLAVVVSIAVLGMITSVLTFGVLDSSAEGEVQGIAVGGAIAGAVVTWLVLGGLYRVLRKGSSDLSTVVERSQVEMEALRRQNVDLQRKVMRGMDLRNGFAPEAIDRQRIVLARPDAWVALGGTVFQLMAPDSMRSIVLLQGAEAVDVVDVFPAAFWLNHYTMGETPQDEDPEATYQQVLDGLEADPSVGRYTAERVRLGSGGDPNGGVLSLKVISTEALWVKLERKPVLGTVDRAFGSMPIDQAGAIGSYLGMLGEAGDGYQWRIGPEASPAAADMQGGNDDADDPPMEEQLTEEDKAEFEALLNSYGEPRMTWPMSPAHIEFSRRGLAEVQMPLLIQRMRVLCVNPDVGKIFEFDFVDDVDDFESQTATFNAILDSVRFLPETV